MRSVECKVQSPKCGIRSAKCGIENEHPPLPGLWRRVEGTSAKLLFITIDSAFAVRTIGPMRVFFVTLLLPFLGCGGCERSAERLSREIGQWITNGTPLPAAQRILEQHQFTCSVTWYTNKQGMIRGGAEDVDAIYWDHRVRMDGIFMAVTNITHLDFKKTNAGGVLTYINGKYSGSRVLTFGP